MSAPEQRGGAADGSTHDASSDSTSVNRDLPRRDQPRPADAVADQAAPFPAVKQPSTDQEHVRPKVDQSHDLPALDPKAVERAGDRTETTQTFDNPDGSRTMRLHAGQSNVRQPDGTFLPVDLALIPGDAGRLKPKVAPVDVSFAPTSVDPILARIAFDADHALAYAMRDATDVRGEVDGSTISYSGVRPGVDLRLSANRSGVKEDLVLASADVPVSHAFTLKLDKLAPKLTDTGAVELVDGDKLIATIPAGFMDDAAGVRSTAVRYGLEKVDASTWVLRVDLDSAWLRDPTRAFPVIVDPSAGRVDANGDDTYVQSGAPSGHSAEAVVIAGSVSDGRGIGRSYLHFDRPDWLADKYVLGASLGLVNTDVSCASHSFTAFEVAQPWDGGIRWPGVEVGQALSTGQLGSCSPTRRGFLPLDREVMTGWTHGVALAHGISVRASDETNGSGHRFASVNSANPPYLDIRYSDEGASFEVTDVLLPTNTRVGNLKAKVINRGSTTWTPNNGFRFGYLIKQGGTVIRTSTFAPSGVTNPFGTATFDVPIDPVAPGEYQVYLSMWTPQNQDFQVAHEVPYGRMDLKVSNVTPTSNLQQPGNGGVVESLTPTLYAEGIDDDNWPAKGLTYKFRICANSGLTDACDESDWTSQSWAPAALRWNKTYFWSVKVHDTVGATPTWLGPLVLTTRVPQPQITSHLAGSPDSTQGHGLDAGIGNYSTVVNDASVATVGPDLMITRTYNSLDPRRDTVFGVGWASRADMRLANDDDRSGNVVVTYPSGRQVRYGRNRDETFASPAGDSTDLVYSTSTGVFTLRDNSGSRWQFDVLGRLVTITDSAGLTERLEYDANDHITTITSDTSSRTLAFTWQGAHVSRVTTQALDPGGQPLVWTYAYEGDRLIKACVPGGEPNCTTYSHTSGSHYRTSVLDDNPKAYWRLSETTGDKLRSATARRDGDNAATQHGVILGGDGALGGTADKSALFDGNSSYVSLPDGLTTTTMSLSVELWFKTTSHGTLIGYADRPFPSGTPSKSTPVLYVGTDGLLYGGFSRREASGPRQVVSTKKVNDDQWHHIVLSAAIDTQTLYLDGESAGTVGGLVDHKQQGKLTLGAGRGNDWPATNGGDFYFGGSIDEVALYLHPLGSLAARQHFGSRSAIDELTGITLPQDGRRFATLTYDDINDRVRTLVDAEGRTWSLDTPKVLDSTRTATLRGPSNYGDWTHIFDTDNGGRQTSREHRGFQRKYEYNTAGFLSATVDENGHRSERTTDDRGNMVSRKTCRSKDSCNTTYFTYVKSDDPLDPRRDRPQSTSDARSSGPDDTKYRTTFTYDAAGRLLKTTSPVPDGLTGIPTETNTYSDGTENAVGGGRVPAGLLTRTVGVRNQVTSYAYRANGDLAEEISPTGLRTRYTYDGIGRRKSVVLLNAGDAVFGTTTYEYTPRSQIAKIVEPTITNPVSGTAHTKVTTNRFDGNGNLLESTVSDLTPPSLGGDPARTTVFGYDANDRLVSTTFPDGGRETRAYLDNGLTEVVTDVGGTAWTSQFDEHRRLLARIASGPNVDPVDPKSTTLTVEFRAYDPAGRLSSTQDAMGRGTSYRYYDDDLPAAASLRGCVTPDGACDVVLDERSYDPAGNLVEQVAAGGRKTVQVFDSAGFVTSMTFDPDGLKRNTTYQRDADGNPTRIERRGAADPARVETSAYGYGPTNQVVREDVFLDASTTLSTSVDRDERGLVRAVTDRRQLTTSYQYNAVGALAKTTHPAADAWVASVRTPGFVRVETLGHNAFGEASHSRDAAGGITTTEWDSMGRPTAGTLPAYTPPGGQPITATTRTEYDKSGNAVKVTDPLNRVTSNTYDPYGRVLTTTLPQIGSSPSVIKSRYDRMGELVSQIDPSGADTRHTYDQLGRRITSTQVDRSSGELAFYTTTTTYDVAGNATAVTTPQGFTARATYDKAGAVLTATDPTNRSTTHGYDIAGRPATTTDPSGLVVGNTYDLLGRQTGVVHSVGGQQLRAWGTSYDASGNIAAKTSPQGRTTSYLHDELGMLAVQTEQVDAGKSITTSFGYDKLGGRSRFVDGDNRATHYSFNSWGLPESVVEPATSGTPAAADRTWTTSYDAAGQVAKLSKPGNVTRTVEYDAQGRPVVERGSGAEAATADRTFGYDLAGRMTRVGGPNGDSTYRYDDRGLLLESHGAAGEESYRYNGDATPASRTDASGTATFGYDQAGRTTSVVDPLSGRTVDYAYDDAGRLSRVSDRAVQTRVNRRLSYDPLGRLVADQVQQVVDSGLPSRVVMGAEYGYDLDDKQTSKKTTSSAGTAANTYAYDGAGRLTSWTDGKGKVTGYGWDNAGNRTSAGEETFTYDERDRLIAGGGATYTYSARGTQTSVTRDGQTTRSESDAFDRTVGNGIGRYSYDSLDRVSDRNGTRFSYSGLSNEAVSDGGNLISRLPNGAAVSDKASEGGAKMLFADRHGDVVGRYLGSGTDGVRTFDPFGKVTSSSGVVSPLGYQGDWTDKDTSDVNMTARWYSPGTGRFTSRDDWTITPMPSTAGNRFGYGDSDPLNNADPSGHNPVCLIGVAAGPGAPVAVGGCELATLAVAIAIIGFGAPDPAQSNFKGGGIARSVRNRLDYCSFGGCKAQPNPCPWGRCGPQPVDRGQAEPEAQGQCTNNCLPPPGCTSYCGPVAPPAPPPPPAWWVNAWRAVIRPDAGSTVAVIATQVAAATAATVTTDPGRRLTDEGTAVTVADPDGDPRPPGVGRPNDDDDDVCNGMAENAPVYGPMEPVNYGDSYVGRPRTGATRATSAAVCLTDIEHGKRLTPLEPAGHKAGLVKGHLVAHMFWGANGRENMVPLYTRVNNPDMLGIENTVKHEVEDGETVFYNVTPRYADDKNPIPIAIRIDAVGNQGFTCHVTIFNNQGGAPIGRRPTC